MTKLVNHINLSKLGMPEDKETIIGPLAAFRQGDLIESQVNDAIAKGAKIIIGGSRPPAYPEGAYYLPTLVTNITKKMRVWHEETFGPVLPIVTFSTEDESIKLANDTLYGLGAIIFSNNTKQAKRVASQIEAGFVDINEGSHLATL